MVLQFWQFKSNKMTKGRRLSFNFTEMNVSEIQRFHLKSAMFKVRHYHNLGGKANLLT